MTSLLLSKEAELRCEADELLGPRGLYDLLAQYGEPHIDGSYALKLMVWRDLDIYIISEDTEIRLSFELGGRLAQMLHPGKMSHRNELIMKTPGLPCGLYWGVYLGNEREGAWKIDIWIVGRSEYDRLASEREEIANRLTQELRIQILEIKDKCWRDPRYRRDYTSMDIYAAVLDDGAKSVAQFDHWLREHKGFGL